MKEEITIKARGITASKLVDLKKEYLDKNGRTISFEAIVAEAIKKINLKDLVWLNTLKKTF